MYQFLSLLVEEPPDSIIPQKWMNFLLLCVDEASCQLSDGTPDTTNLNPQQSCTSGQRSSQASASAPVTHNTSGWLLYMTVKQLKRSHFPSLLTVSASWSWTTEAEFRGGGCLQVVPVSWWWGQRRCVCSPQTGLCSLPAEEISKTLRTCLQRLLFVLPPPGETCQTLKMLTIILSNIFFFPELQPLSPTSSPFQPYTVSTLLFTTAFRPKGIFVYGSPHPIITLLIVILNEGEARWKFYNYRTNKQFPHQGRNKATEQCHIN